MNTCERTAYQRMQEHGLCNRGVVPKFYDSVQSLKPHLYSPHLDSLLNDGYFPDAILLEYIPRIVPLHWSNYTKARGEALLKGLKEIQAAGVLHDDVYPRNAMVFEDEVDPKRERALWVDFDRAQTYNTRRIPKRQREWMEEDIEFFKEVMGDMEHDQKKGKTERTWYGIGDGDLTQEDV